MTTKTEIKTDIMSVKDYMTEVNSILLNNTPLYKDIIGIITDFLSPIKQTFQVGDKIDDRYTKGTITKVLKTKIYINDDGYKPIKYDKDGNQYYTNHYYEEYWGNCKQVKKYVKVYPNMRFDNEKEKDDENKEFKAGNFIVWSSTYGGVCEIKSVNKKSITIICKRGYVETLTINKYYEKDGTAYVSRYDNAINKAGKHIRKIKRIYPKDTK